MRTVSYEQYIAANLRLEELLNVVNDNTPLDSPLAKEFQKVSDMSMAVHTLSPRGPRIESQ